MKILTTKDSSMELNKFQKWLNKKGFTNFCEHEVDQNKVFIEINKTEYGTSSVTYSRCIHCHKKIRI